MWCAIEVTADNGEPLWLGNPDVNGHRSVGRFEDAAVFWQAKHAETAMELYMRQKNAGTSQIRIVNVGDRLLGSGLSTPV